MARPTDNSDPHRKLPQIELNPLTNPLLAQNMGRWAEIYFTTPPEKREEAVLELLRELEAKSAAQTERPDAEPSVAERSQALEPHPAALLAEAVSVPAPGLGNAQASITCPSCGASYPAEQRFCGSCGATLHQRRSPQTTAPAVLRGFAPAVPDDFAEDFAEEEPVTSGESWVSPSYVSRNEKRWLLGGTVRELFEDYRPTRYTLRVYLGATLAILVCILCYVAWRSAQASSGKSRSLPQTEPTAATQAATSPQPAPQETEAVENPAQNRSQASPPSRDTRAQETTSTPDADRGQTRAAGLLKTPSERSSPAQAQHGNGSEELAIAESYLSGSQGRTRDSSEAAKWLWKSMAKQNTTAALRLSDLYARGDGVPKSCDQARLLLEAAGRKGLAGAAERIRNLQALGCQ